MEVFVERKKGRRVFDPEGGIYWIYFRSKEVNPKNGHVIIGDFSLPKEVVAGNENRVATSGFQLNKHYIILDYYEFNNRDEECIVIRRKRPHFGEENEVLIPTRLLEIGKAEIRNDYP